MNLTLAGVEELELFPTAEAREQAIAEHAAGVRGADLMLGIAICVIVAGASWMLARYVVLGGLSAILPRPLPAWARDFVTLAIVANCMFLTLRVLHRWGVRRELRAKLLKLNVPVCLGCGYLLRGLDETVAACPECGRALDERVRDIIREADYP